MSEIESRKITTFFFKKKTKLTLEKHGKNSNCTKKIVISKAVILV